MSMHSIPPPETTTIVPPSPPRTPSEYQISPHSSDQSTFSQTDVDPDNV